MYMCIYLLLSFRNLPTDRFRAITILDA